MSVSRVCHKNEVKMANIRVRTTSKGIKRYQAYIRIKGFKPIMKTFSKYSAAQDWAKKIEVQMQDGSYIDYCQMTDDSRLIYLKDLIEYFRDNVAPLKYSYCDKYKYMYDWWIEKIGDIKISELKTPMLSSCKQKLINEKILKGKKEVKRNNATINKYLMCLSAVLTFAVKELEILEVNPMSKVSNMPKPKGRTRFLSLDEIKALISACKNYSDFVYIFVLIDLSTGGRYSEVLNLTVENIDFQNSQVHYLNTKNKENRGVPIDTNVLNIVKHYLDENNIVSGYIFLNPKTKKLYFIRGILQKIIKKIGLKDFHIHDIRHTTASYIAMNGGSLLDIAEILGHKSLVMARRYSHLTDKHTANVLSKVTGKILPDISL